MKRRTLLICLLFVCSPALPQSSSENSACATPEAVLRRYVAALGGESAVNQIQTIVVEAKATEPHTFNLQSAAHYRYRFQWKAPNLVAVKRHYLFGTATIIFDGTAWTNYDGRVSHNEDDTPVWRTKLRSRPYNDYPSFLMFRVLADPFLVARSRDLYRGFETLPETQDLCSLRALGTSEWGGARRDMLSFDLRSGLLKTWAIQMGQPGQEIYSRFQFEDYRQAGAVKIPFSIYFEFYQTKFQVTQVVLNAPLPDADFTPRP